MKRRGVHLNAIVACLLTVAAVAAAPGAQTGQGVLTGLVTDAVTRTPIVGALVTASPGGVAAVTNAAGVYQMTLPAGTVSLTVAAQNRPFQSAFGVIVRNGGATTVNFALSLPAATGMLTGYVRSAATNAPIGIANATVSVSPGGNSTVTDANGRYELSLPPGTYTVTASAVSYETASAPGVAVSNQAVTTRDLQLVSLSKPVVVSAVVEVLHIFASTADGENPFVLIRATDGDFYGMTIKGGDLNGGTIFKMTPAGAFTVLHQFVGGVDGQPTALIQGTDGDFYGLTNSTAFRMTPGGTVTILHVFAGGAEGYPSGLIQGADGDFYGTTQREYPSDHSVFRMTRDGSVTILHTFAASVEGYPGGLIQGTDGDFYGTTTFSSNGSNFGTVFKMTAAGIVKALHTFTGGSYGPFGLIQASDGNFYGMMIAWDGRPNSSTIFRMTPTGDVTVLHSSIGGDYSRAWMQAADGNFYGTSFGIPEEFGGGDIFRMTPAGVLTFLHSFNILTSAGSNPAAALVQGTDGDFYGTTFYGGIPRQDGRGTLFRMRVSASAAIAGHVRDAITNAPVPNALLRFSPGGQSVPTDTRGHYAVALPAGAYTVTVSAARYLNSTNATVAVVNQATTTLDVRLSRLPVLSPMFNPFRAKPRATPRYSAWIYSTTTQPFRTALQATGARAGRWEIEAFGGATFASQPEDGTGSLPPAGVPFMTTTGTPSRRVSSWYLSDGAQLLNGVNAALGASHPIAPLDSALNASLVERPSGGGGVRVSRILTTRLTAELTVEFSAVLAELSSDASAGIEASRVSFISAWEGLASAGQFVDTAVTSVRTTQIDNGHQVVATGAINVALKTSGKAIPYVTVGAGVSSNSGTTVSASLLGDYRFLMGGITPVHETDSVTVRFTPADQGAVGVLGAGFKYQVSARLGLRFDYRTYLGPNKNTTVVDSTPSVSTLAPAGSGASATTPGIQFSNNPAIGINSSLSGPPISDFRTFTGAGIQRHARVTMGVFWRF